MSGSIIVKLQGGLGNQLFQYAYAKRMQQLFSDKQIVLDVSYFQSAHIRSLELQKLSIDADVEWSEKKRPFWETMYTAFRAEKSLLGKAGRKLRSWPLMEKAGYYFNYSGSDYWTPGKNLKDLYLAGYFQNEKQIRPVRDHLIEAVKPKDGLGEKAEDYLHRIRNGASIGVSVRAGQDYEDMGWQVCSKEYYLDGLEQLTADGKPYTVFVFSDCLEKIRNEQWFSGYDVVYVDGCSAAEGLYLLTQCDDFVIANSTFSWWGAYLSRSEGKRIILPEYFIGNDKTGESGLHLEEAVYLPNRPGKESD